MALTRAELEALPMGELRSRQQCEYEEDMQRDRQRLEDELRDEQLKDHGYTDGELDAVIHREPGSTRSGAVRNEMERNRDQLSKDEQECGVAFTDQLGWRVDPTKVFKSVVNTYADDKGNAVRLWKSENA